MEEEVVKDYQGQKVTLDNQVLRDYKENPVRQESRDLVDLWDPLDYLALMGKTEFLAPLENVDQRAILDYLVLQGRLVLLGRKVQLVNPDNQENLEFQGTQELLENQVPRESKAKRDHQGHQVYQEKKVHQDLVVYQDFLVNGDQLVYRFVFQYSKYPSRFLKPTIFFYETGNARCKRRNRTTWVTRSVRR